MRRVAISRILVLAAVAAGGVAGGRWWGPADREHTATSASDPERFQRSSPAIESEQARRLAALGYVAGSRPAAARTGVTVRTPQARAGLNFYVSGHGPEAILTDMAGTTLHRWRFEYERAFSNAPLPTTPVGRGFWRRALLLPNGDVIAIFEGQGVICVDSQSRLRWAVPGGAHHDLFRAPDGTIWVLTRKVQLIPQINPTDPVLEDFVTVLTGDGRIVREISVLESFWRSEHRGLLDLAPRHGDLLHTNTLLPLTGDGWRGIAAFRQGNLLLSIPRLNALAILDPQREAIVWSLVGQFRFQHTPAPVATGGLVLLDNQWRPDRSRAIEIDPVTQALLWRYEGSDRAPFRTEFNGAAYRLDNGNTLLVESDTGRAIEVTRAGEIVWEFRSPHRTADGLTAALFDLKRIDPGQLRFAFSAER